MAVFRLLLVACAIAIPLTGSAQPVPPGPGGAAGGRGGQARPLPPRGVQQPEQTRGTGVMRGAVVAADNGTPVRHAQVRVSGQGVGSRVATTDAQGRFEIRELAAGRYTVSAQKGGFVSLQYGQRRPTESGTPIELGDGQMVDKLIIALPRGSVITGRISDEFGEPVANAVVSAMRYGYQAGARRLLPAAGQNSRDTTDDQGMFRLFGLPPGEYVVSATLRGGGPEATDPSGENTGYAPTYYPGTGNITEAQRIPVALAQEQNGIVFSMIATKLVRVSGAVLNSQGVPVQGGVVMLTPAASRVGTGAMMQTLSGRIEQGGQFRISSVPPGRYVAQVRPMNGPRGGRGGAFGDMPLEFGRADVTVSGEDLNGVVIVTAPGGRINGQIVTDGGAPAQLRVQQISVTARAVELDNALPPGGGMSRVNDDWTFEINGVFDARLLRVNLPSGWMLKAVTLEGQDITDVPLDIPPGQAVTGVRVVVTDKLTEVSGQVLDSRGRAVTDVAVVVFPADEALWTYQSRFVRTTRPDLEGRFQIRGLPASERYLAVAVQGLEDGQAGDPEFLARARESASTFTLRDAETKTMELRWAPPR